MGQGQSTSQQGPGDRNTDCEKKDYYELLGVEQIASSEEIKKAYRKKALELHPDRNFGNVEAATNLFAEIQSAYEVLSDPQERSWYDSHRDAFLGAGAGAETSEHSYNVRMTTATEILKLFSKFSPKMEFTDSPNGFYGGLRETFHQLALEEGLACRWDNIDGVDYPSFGSCDDDFQVVREFYNVWGGFATKKSFSWKDVYRYSEAPDRRVRRMMEKENKRLREGAIREFNEAVRSLVAFAKKRDPRYKSYKVSLSQHREELRRSAAAQASRSRAANEAKLRDHVLQDWAKSQAFEEDAAASSEGETEHFECIVCHKTFKSQNQIQDHERSKKHIKAVKQLRWEMKIQNEELNLDGDAVTVTDSVEDQTTGDNLHEGNPVPESSIGEKTLDELRDESEHESTITSLGLDTTATLLLGPFSAGPNIPQTNQDDADNAPREVLEHRPGPGGSSTSGEILSDVDELSGKFSTAGLEAASLAASHPAVAMKMGRAKQKRAKKAQLAAQESNSIKCNICNAPFATRNRLFSHIKSNHPRR
ncbi:hypothetical protein BJY04DRAFT_211279 [Aspergillus karnatakaensis]|uniref:putative C2H2 finger domain protein n=1 Tax=Aspergillus karnatakaensis TaxID=1810916 RepID=UPI003CCCD499